MASVVYLGLLIGGLVAWHWKLIHEAWQDWRSSIGRMKNYRKLFWWHSWRGILVTAAAAALLFVWLHL